MRNGRVLLWSANMITHIVEHVCLSVYLIQQHILYELISAIDLGFSV